MKKTEKIHPVKSSLREVRPPRRTEFNRVKVLVAMSGGVDSSVAAALLVKSGYDVTGAFMVNYNSETEGLGGSCWRGDYEDALRVAAKLGIPLLRLDFTKEYKKMVLDYMFREYALGRTPNPDVLCNKFIKFGVWLVKAKKLGFDFMATGHYAQLKTENRKQKTEKITVRLLQAVDDNKDQTYFLHQLTQAQLKHVLFPIGAYPKERVRMLAKKFGLPTADKEESMGICFIGEVPMKKFLMKKIKLKKGKIILSSGEVAGEHDGLAFYTIGERVGGLSFRAEAATRLKSRNPSGNPEGIPPLIPTKSKFGRDDKDTRPIFVVDKNIRHNELVVGYEGDALLYKKEIKVKNINWIAGRPSKFPLKCEVRLRHRQPLQRAAIRLQTSDCRSPIAEVQLNKPQRAVTPGQFAVFYSKGECLGGGVIE